MSGPFKGPEWISSPSVLMLGGSALGMSISCVVGCRQWCHPTTQPNQLVITLRNGLSVPGHTMRDLGGPRDVPRTQKSGLTKLKVVRLWGGEWDRLCESGDGIRRETHVVRDGFTPR